MSFLTNSRIKNLPMGSPEWFAGQKEMVKTKPLVKKCYDLWYKKLIADALSVKDTNDDKKIILELGSGSSYLKEILPEVITSDIEEGIAEKVIDARKIPYPDNSVKAIFLTHVFHHIPDIELFLHEANRVLVPGGVISIVDCARTPFAKFFFGKIHPEPYDDQSSSWTFPQNNSMLDSNQALTWIVFYRDQQKFKSLFPKLTVSEPTLLPWFGYLASGGVNLINFVPRPMAPLMSFFDKCLSPLDSLCALHWHITVRKD